MKQTWCLTPIPPQIQSILPVHPPSSTVCKVEVFGKQQVFGDSVWKVVTHSWLPIYFGLIQTEQQVLRAEREQKLKLQSIGLPCDSKVLRKLSQALNKEFVKKVESSSED